jgi:uncharacterized coiled-coil protein SlyX
MELVNKLTDHDAEQRTEIDRQADRIQELDNILGSVDKDHAIKKLATEIERLRDELNKLRPRNLATLYEGEP